jgi:peptide/nickel transport system substrate-binding protein
MAARTRLVAGLGAVFLIAACTPNEVPGQGSQGNGETGGSSNVSADGPVRFLIAENFWGDWTPYESTAQSQSRLNNHIYDYLLEFPTGSLDEPEAMLATEWEQLDATTWRFTLRGGVTFHDGSEFDGEDVKASIEWASGAAEQDTVLGNRWVPTTVEILDSHTVQLVTEQPLAAIFDAIRRTPIISSEDAAAGAEAMAREPNGTGPFLVVDETQTEKIMEANEDYWREPPVIKELVWEFVADAQTRVNALLAGQAHVIDRVPVEHHGPIEAEDGFAVESMTAAEQVNLWSIPGRVPEWDTNQTLRQAVMMAIDRAALTESLVQGNSIPARSFMPSETLYYREGEPAYDQDLEEASRMIQEEGLEGLEFEVWAAPGFLPASERVAQAIVANLQEIGLAPTLVTADVAGLVDDAHGEAGTGLLYHISWSSGGEPASAMGIYGTGNSWHNNDPLIDEYLTVGKTSVDDAEREQAYVDLQAHLWETAPHVPLYYSDFSVAHVEELQDLRVLPSYETNFYPASLSSE